MFVAEDGVGLPLVFDDPPVVEEAAQFFTLTPGDGKHGLPVPEVVPGRFRGFGAPPDLRDPSPDLARKGAHLRHRRRIDAGWGRRAKPPPEGSAEADPGGETSRSGTGVLGQDRLLLDDPDAGELLGRTRGDGQLGGLELGTNRAERPGPRRSLGAGVGEEVLITPQLERLGQLDLEHRLGRVLIPALQPRLKGDGGIAGGGAASRRFGGTRNGGARGEGPVRSDLVDEGSGPARTFGIGHIAEGLVEGAGAIFGAQALGAWAETDLGGQASCGVGIANRDHRAITSTPVEPPDRDGFAKARRRGRVGAPGSGPPSHGGQAEDLLAEFGQAPKLLMGTPERRRLFGHPTHGVAEPHRSPLQIGDGVVEPLLSAQRTSSIFRRKPEAEGRLHEGRRDRSPCRDDSEGAEAQPADGYDEREHRGSGEDGGHGGEGGVGDTRGGLGAFEALDATIRGSSPLGGRQEA